MTKNHVYVLFILVFIFIAGPVFAGPNPQKDLENLGGAIYRDLNLSLNQRMPYGYGIMDPISSGRMEHWELLIVITTRHVP